MPRLPIVYLFSGQGSQYFQMGRGLYESNDAFRSRLQHFDAQVATVHGYSVLGELYSRSRNNGELFESLRLTHPAIFMVECSLAFALREAGLTADYTVGASLGTFAAAVVSGCWQADDALRVVVREVDAFEQHCPRGGMLAVLSGSNLHRHEFLAARSELAAENFSEHFVLSALEAELAQIQTWLTERGIAQQRLPVPFAFHSRWIDSARDQFVSLMNTLPTEPPRIPMLACHCTEFVRDLSAEFAWDCVRKRICFAETVAQLEMRGPHRYIDLGPAGTLATLLKYILPRESHSVVHSILTPFGRDVENFAEVIRAAP